GNSAAMAQPGADASDPGTKSLGEIAKGGRKGRSFANLRRVSDVDGGDFSTNHAGDDPLNWGTAVAFPSTNADGGEEVHVYVALDGAGPTQDYDVSFVGSG